MFYITRYLLFLLLFINCTNAYFEYCDHIIDLNTEYAAVIQSPNYPARYYSGSSCRFQVFAPFDTVNDYQVELTCDISIDKITDQCSSEIFYVSVDGDRELRGSEYLCGTGTITRTSIFRSLTFAYISSNPTNTGYKTSGKFKCTARAIKQPCDCGWSTTTRIVNGRRAGLTEFPQMAALSNDELYFCGGVIISHRVVLTAAHCLKTYYPNWVIVGDNDMKSATESPYYQKHSVWRTFNHEQYDPITTNNDIALVVTVTNIEWSRGVGPICLPFLFKQSSFTGYYADLVGWGTTIFAGPTSNYLMKTTVQVNDNSVCDQQYDDMNSNKLCTKGDNTDSCQYDSGGPVIWRNQRLQLIGLISYGKSCGTTPSVNTRITSYLDWIVRNTGSNYCTKL